ncbi:MAG: hypothetical protein PHV30_00230 [Candidatus Margulisbacteria bacterium]|nr:hypothetical protein [Candidatus Margulisiibacteriota bacterium]
MIKAASNKYRWLISSVYFVQGIVVITGMAEFILTRNAFNFSWLQLAFLSALTTLTWCIKPIYGFFTDLLPLFARRRKPYLLISSLLTTLGYIFLAFWGTNFMLITCALIIMNIGLGFSDVIIDGLVVETSTPENVGKYQALCWRAKATGILIASLLSGFILERAVFSGWLKGTSLTGLLASLFPMAFSTQLIGNINILDIRCLFLFTGLWPLLVFVLTLLFKEPPLAEKIKHDFPSAYILSAVFAFILTALVIIFALSTKPWLPGLSNETISSVGVILIWSIWIMSYFVHLIKRKQATMTLFYAAIFLFLWRFTPNFGAPWSNYFINTLKLSQEKLGYVATLTSLSWIIGGWLYKQFFDTFPIKKVLFWTVIIGVVLSFSQLAIATPALGNAIGNIWIIKYSAAILLYPFYFFGYHFGSWQVLMQQPPILNLDALLSFLLEMMFMISFLPLLKLAALVTPKGVEATNFSILASVMNLGLAFGSISGGLIYTYLEGQYHLAGISFTGLHLTIIIGALTSLICLPVLRKI